MIGKSFLFALCLSKYIFSANMGSLPISVRGRVISTEAKVITVVKDSLKEIKLTNNFFYDLFIFGRIDKKPFLYKIEKDTTKVFRIQGDEIEDLSYILKGKKYKLEKYSDIKNKRI